MESIRDLNSMSEEEKIEFIKKLENEVGKNKEIINNLLGHERPPLGLIPARFAYIEDRLKDIDEAINRYIETDTDVPNSWVVEKHMLEGMLLSGL